MVSTLSSGDFLSTGLIVVFFAAAALTICLGLILAYHWFVHAHSAFASLIALCAYAAVSFLLLSTMATAIVLFA